MLMDYYLFEERTTYILEMAEKGRLLSIKQMAEKFDCSQATVKRMIRYLKHKGHVIKYSRSLRKFYVKK